MELTRPLIHAGALALEGLLLFALIDARLAFLCRWCGTPPQPREPLLPMAFWHAVFGLSSADPIALCQSFNLEGPIVFLGILLAAHAIYLLKGDR